MRRGPRHPRKTPPGVSGMCCVNRETRNLICTDSRLRPCKDTFSCPCFNAWAAAPGWYHGASRMPCRVRIARVSTPKQGKRNILSASKHSSQQTVEKTLEDGGIHRPRSCPLVRAGNAPHAQPAPCRSFFWFWLDVSPVREWATRPDLSRPERLTGERSVYAIRKSPIPPEQNGRQEDSRCTCAGAKLLWLQPWMHATPFLCVFSVHVWMDQLCMTGCPAPTHRIRCRG